MSRGWWWCVDHHLVRIIPMTRNHWHKPTSSHGLLYTNIMVTPALGRTSQGRDLVTWWVILPIPYGLVNPKLKSCSFWRPPDKAWRHERHPLMTIIWMPPTFHYKIPDKQYITDQKSYELQISLYLLSAHHPRLEMKYFWSKWNIFDKMEFHHDAEHFRQNILHGLLTKYISQMPPTPECYLSHVLKTISPSNCFIWELRLRTVYVDDSVGFRPMEHQTNTKCWLFMLRREGGGGVREVSTLIGNYFTISLTLRIMSQKPHRHTCVKT